MRLTFLHLLDSAKFYGLNRDKYHYLYLMSEIPPKSPEKMQQLDRVFTDAVIAFSKDVTAGADIDQWVSNDEVSLKYEQKSDAQFLTKMGKIRSAADMVHFLEDPGSNDKEYQLLKNELRKQIASADARAVNELTSCLNLYRWIHHFHFEKWIVVNIASASLRYYETDSLKLQMKVVVGKPTTRSPRFATWCNEIILYPYWNVPRSIAVKELLPRFKKHPGSVDEMNMQVLGRDGKVIDHHNIRWAKYNRYNLPYNFRQCTGCDNSLGVIKFNLTDPFYVYLHDTNFKLAFLKSSRYLSHGCIRVEKPIELGNYILDNKLDSTFLKSCLKDQEPTSIRVEKPIPVFVLYMPAEVVGSQLILCKDIYHLF